MDIILWLLFAAVVLTVLAVYHQVKLDQEDEPRDNYKLTEEEQALQITQFVMQPGTGFHDATLLLPRNGSYEVIVLHRREIRPSELSRSPKPFVVEVN